MQWAQYHCNVVHRYQVAIDGWPEDIPFANLSDVSSSLPQLELLLQRWKSGAIHWKTLSDEEVEELQEKRDRLIENGEVEARTRHTRSDKGKKRKHHPSDNNPLSRKKHKSAETILDDDEGENPHEGPAIPTDDDPTSSTSAIATTTDTSRNTTPTVNPGRTPNVSSDTSSGTDVCSASSPGSGEQAFEDLAESILNFDAAALAPY